MHHRHHHPTDDNIAEDEEAFNERYPQTQEQDEYDDEEEWECELSEHNGDETRLSSLIARYRSGKMTTLKELNEYVDELRKEIESKKALIIAAETELAELNAKIAAEKIAARTANCM